MQDYCSTVGNYFEPVCVNAWYYVVDNDMILGWFIALGNWWANQPLLLLLSWNFLPWISYILGWYYLILPSAAPNIKNSPYAPSD